MRQDIWKQWIEQEIEKHAAEFTAAADRIHTCAELSGQEHQSAALLCDLLEAHGFAVERGLQTQPTAFRAVYGSGPVRIGYVCEYDALAGLQQDDLPCQKGNGAPGHGCGHNLLGAGSAAAAIALKQLVEEGLQATIVVYGTPAEETLEGKAVMIENGYFRDLDVCLAWHPLDHNNPGEVRFKAAAAFTVTFHGRAAHACNCPELGRSALDAAELTNIGCNYLREHIDRDSYLHYSYLDGGQRPNIVPDTAKLWYMVRADTYAQMKELELRVQRVVQGACMMTDTTASFETLGESHDSKLNFTLAHLVHDCMCEIGAPHFTPQEKAYAKEIARAVHLPGVQGELEERVLPVDGTPKKDNGSSDIADVSHLVPVVNLNTACYGRYTPNHSWAVTAQANKPAAHQGMLFAAKVLALAGVYLVVRPALLAAVKEEFEKAGQYRVVSKTC